MNNGNDSNITDENYTHARFWKCALQVNPHSYRANYRGQASGFDPKTYADEICRICMREGIKVVGLADHGRVSDAEEVRQRLDQNGIVVFPGFEITTTEKVHWVCLFPETTSAQELERYLGKLQLTNPQYGTRPSPLGGQKLMQEVENLGGFCYAAHVTSNKGVLKEKLNNLWTSAELRVVQIPGKIEDLPHSYKSIILNQNSDYCREYPVTVINARDIVNPGDLCDPRATTFIKMTRPCFESFLMAFEDPESRVCLSDNMAERHYSYIESIHIEGGFLDGLSAEISDHLNAVIGGRGTGKSTFLECIRYALDIPHKGEDARRQGEQIVRENLGRFGGRISLKLRSASNHMKPYTVIRRYGEPPRVIDDGQNESLLHPGKDLLPRIEIYGQNEIYELAKNPDSLTRTIERFLPGKQELESRLAGSYRRLKENSSKLVKYLEMKDEHEQKIASLPKLEEQVRQFEDLGIEDRLKLVPLLEKQRQLEKRVIEENKRVRSGRRELEESLPDLVFMDESILEELPHADLFRHARSVLKTLVEKMRHILEDIDKTFEDADAALNELSRKITHEIKNSELQLEKDFEKVPSAGGKDGNEIGRNYQQLLREIEQVNPTREKLALINSLVNELEQDRRNLLGEISDLRSRRLIAKQSAVRK
ncbi:MAG: ATPase, partial [Gammaproteobacteria bacterium]|nr:ATPase [Gammaproteobacteria bacterium]